MNDQTDDSPRDSKAAKTDDLVARGYAPLTDAHCIEYGLGAGRGVRKWFWGEVLESSTDELLKIGAHIDPNGVWSKEELREEFGRDWSDAEILASVRGGFFNDAEPDEEAWAAFKAMRGAVELHTLKSRPASEHAAMVVLPPPPTEK